MANTSGVQVNILNAVPSQINYNDPLGVDFLYDLVNLDIDPNFQLVSGLYVVMQDVIKRLITPTASVFTNLPSQYASFAEPYYGYSIIGLLGSSIALNQGQSNMIATQIKQEIQKDERVLNTNVNVNFNLATSTLEIAITVTVITDQVFTLIFALTQDQVPILIANLNPQFNQ